MSNVDWSGPPINDAPLDDRCHVQGGTAWMSATLPLERRHLAFKLKGMVIGAKGRNVRRFESATGARLRVHDESEECMELRLMASTQNILDQAMQLAEELINNVYEEFDRRYSYSDNNHTHY